MKKTLTVFSLIAHCSLLIALLSCEQPFKAGLGPIFDLRDPTITLTSPASNSFISGTQVFTGWAEDDTKLDAVYFQLVNYQEIDLQEEGYSRFDHDLGTFYRITDTSGSDRYWDWTFTLPTKLEYANGERVFQSGVPIMIRLLVIDSATKEGKTDTVAFIPKNDGPQIRMSAPTVYETSELGGLTSGDLNYGYILNQYIMYMDPGDILPRSKPFSREMDTKSWMTGMISDDEGINSRYDEAAGLYPPQIRFWQVYFDDSVIDGAYPADQPPGTDKVPWVNLKDVGQIEPPGYSKSLTFMYKLPDESGAYYGFEIRAQSIDKENSKIRYPRDYVPDFDNKPDDYKKENSYVLIIVREPQEYPTLELYQLQDIYGDKSYWRDANGVMQYSKIPLSPDTAIAEQLEKEGKHPYVNKSVVSKNGAFTLRMKAYHSGGIATAEVYWEKDDKSARGRFIWDPADTLPYAGWAGVPVSGSKSFEEWGLNEPDGNIRVRSFVFTYTDGNARNDNTNTAAYDRLPDTADFQNNVMGDIRRRSKIQRFVNSAYKNYDFDRLPKDFDPANWTDVWKLDEGTYNISVYTTSKSGTPIDTPFSATISIDRTPPRIELNYIEGSAGTDSDGTIIVNGVIQPRFLLSESEPADTGFRTGSTEKWSSDYFKKSDNSGWYPEQAYILVHNENKAAMDTYLAANPWPDFSNITSSSSGGSKYYYTMPVPGGGELKISKHGPIIESKSRFRTSHIYQDDSDTDYLEDGKYWLYAFARDNALNVGDGSRSSPSFPIPIRVDLKSDYPTFDWTGNSVKTDVTEPDWAYDYGGINYGDTLPQKRDASFIAANGVKRNIFTNTSAINIKVTVKDDDSLDLGDENGAPSNIKVTLTGSKPDNTTGEIKPWSEDQYLIKLSDADIKKAFSPQTIADGKRISVKEKTGTIDQTMLLNGLKSNSSYDYLFENPKDTYSSLPDGIYRVGISIGDYPPAKLIMEEPFLGLKDTKLADAIFVNIKNQIISTPSSGEYLPDEFFWIAVDSKAPDIVIDPDTKPSGIISPTAKEHLKGTVSDANGPIKLADWSVRKGNTVISEMKNPGSVPMLEIPSPNWWDKPYTYDGKWNYKFDFMMNMNNNNEGTFTFEIKFEDRFGNPSTQRLTYVIDNTPPVVSLTKKIETFDRSPFDDVYLDNRVYLKPWINDPATDPTNISSYQKYVQLNSTPEGIVKNKKRLAVKTVNFTVNAVDNNKVMGIRWWLLPANTGSRTLTVPSDNGALDSSGTVLDYNAFPAKYYYDAAGNPQPGIYYGEAGNSNGFDRGAFGIVDMDNRKFTIDVDTTKLRSITDGYGANMGNGEYRLHIIAIDSAGLTSTYKDTDINIENVLQEVFFLQEEDKPYIPAVKGISPGILVTGHAWPTASEAEMDVLGGAPIVRGTIYENNGFFGDKDGATFRAGSITIWFSNNEAAATTDLPYNSTNLHDPTDMYNWEYLVANDRDITGYTKVKIPNPPTGLYRQGRNLSLALELPTLFPAAFQTDGRKRYIIKATDSPVNKLLNDGNGGTPMGIGNTTSFDEDVRVSRWQQYAFIYDGKPPEVVIDNPPTKQAKTFGTNFADDDPDDDSSVPYKKGFNLVGSIYDMNLATMTYYYKNQGSATVDNRYYFEYYVDSNATAKRLFILDSTKATITYYDKDDTVISYSPAIPTSPAPVKVEFNILPSVVADEIIPNFFEDKTVNGTLLKALVEGQHTLTLIAKDKSGKEGIATVNFIKDTKPPSITFSNLTGNANYDKDNKSRVDNVKIGKNWWGSGGMTDAEKQLLLLGNASTAPLPLSTIFYDTGVPELKGTITDLVSNIDVSVSNTESSVGSGDVNIDGSKFEYWIDGETAARHLALIDGADTRNVRWTILLTSDGTLTGTPLADGVHTIRLTASDKAGMVFPPSSEPSYMIAFRIDSKPPRSHVSVSGASAGVYGNVAYQNSPMFTLNLTADDANLDKVELRIVRKAQNGGSDTQVSTQTFTARDSITWTYYSSGSSPPISLTGTGLTPPTDPLTDDYVLFQGTYGVPKFDNNVPDGKYEAIVVAYDTAKNKSDEYVFPFTYDKTQPKIIFTNPDDENKNGSDFKPEDFIKFLTAENGVKYGEVVNGLLTPNNKINRLTTEQLRIQGNVEDAFSAVRQVQSQVEKWDWNSTGWVVIESWKDVRDYLTNSQTQISWTKNLLGQDRLDTAAFATGKAGTGLDIRDPTTWYPVPSNTAKISAEGLYRIQIRAKDSSTIVLGVGGANDGWVYPSGQGNPIVSDYMYFFYDRTDPELTLDNIGGVSTNATYFPKPAGGFTFEGTVTDNNRFAKVEVKFVTAGGKENIMAATLSKNDPSDPTVSLNQGAETQKWEAVFADTSGSSFPDGRYTVTVTVYDMTGRTNKTEMKFILDSTPPGARFTGPAKERVIYKGYGDDSDDKKPTPTAAAPNVNNVDGFASVFVNSGETAVITGETWDKPGPNGESGSASGVDQMWFHIGYIDGSTAFPSKTAIKAWEDEMITRYARNVGVVNVETNGTLTVVLTPAPSWNGLADLTVKQRNKYMDLVSERRATSETDTTGNAWFKLGGVHKPTGFIIDNPNIYDWRMEIPNKVEKMPSSVTTDPDYDNYLDYIASDITLNKEIGGLKLYNDTVTVKGRKYYVNPTGTTPIRQMVRAVEGQAGGVYRLPLWIRLVDIAGNVEYYCHDIWIDMNADIPSTSIESPGNGSKGNARGGTINVDGVAKSNTSVFDVIFRVFVDNEQNSDLDGVSGSKSLGSLPNYATAKYVRIPGYDTVTNTKILTDIIPAAYRTPSPSWQKANLTLLGGNGEKLIPWSVMLNSEDEIKSQISTYGFASSGSGTPDMIRVWLEVFVFNGESGPIRSSIYADDTLQTGGTTGPLYGTPSDPKPYVKAFYIKTAAPQVTHPDVGSLNGSVWVWNATNWLAADPNPNGYKGAGTEIRRDKFAIRAILDPYSAGSSLTEVSYRIKLNGGSYNTWTQVWKTGDTWPNNVNGISISQRSVAPPAGTPSRTRYNFVYNFDSKIETTINNYAAINGGAWKETGGTITVQVRIKDNQNPANEADTTFVIGVDNFAPVAGSERTNSKVAGTNVDFLGRVYDYATLPADVAMTTDYTPRKIDRIYAWFKKGGQFVHMTDGTTTANPPGLRTMSAFKDRNATVVTTGTNNDTVSSITLTAPGSLFPISYPGLGGKQAHNADYIRELSQGTAIPGTNMVFSPVNSRDYDVRWSFTLDSTKLPDGDITLCYLVVDAAILRDASGNELIPGNASYYEQEISVRNKYPVIDKITLYTDNNGQGAQYTQDDTVEYVINDYRSKMFNNMAGTDAEINKTGYLNTGFISKNKYIGFKVETRLGNNNLNFRLQHVTRQRVALDKTTVQTWVNARNTANNINLYTIARHGDYSSANWRALGVPIDNPSIGTHFVLSPSGLKANGDLPDDFKSSTTAEVWKYTLVGTTPNYVQKSSPNGGVAQQNGAAVYGPGPDDAFAFKGDTYFLAGAPPAAPTRINEYNGSHPDADDASGSDDPGTTAFFLIRVWDTVNTTGQYAESWVNDQLYDAVVVGMNVYLSDTKKPTARLYDLNPYTETAVTGNNIDEDNQTATIRNAADPQAIGSNIVRGGLFNTNTVRELVKSGYIDPRDSSFALNPKNSDGLPAVTDNPLKESGDAVPAAGATRDKVSGRVILRGLAQDDQLIDEIWVQINPDGGTNPAKRILRLDAGKMVAADSNLAYAVETLHWKTGHTVEWAYVWNTETDPTGRTGGGPASNVTVQVYVKDKNGNRFSNSSAADGTASAPLGSVYVNATADTNVNPFHNQVNVDIVPYVTGFERETPKFTTKRSLQGWYSFYQGEPNIALRGYNLSQSTSNVTVSISSGTSGGTTTNMTGLAYNGTPDNTKNRFYFTMPTTAASGRLNVTVGSTAAYNHTSVTTNPGHTPANPSTRSWNTEYNSYTPGSELWINKPHAHIWRTSPDDPTSSPRTFIGNNYNSTLKTSSSSQLNHPGMALEYQGSGAGTLHGAWAVYGNANSYYGTNTNVTTPIETGTPGEPYATPDISIYNGGGASAANMGFVHQNDGRTLVLLKSVVNNTSISDSGNYLLQNYLADGSTQRWQNVRLSKRFANTSTNAGDVGVGRIYMTAYFSENKGLWYGTRGGNNTDGTGGQSNATMFIDGGYKSSVTSRISDSGNGVGPATSAGEYSAIDYDNTGPIIAYYDQQHDTVRVALGLSVNPGNGSGQWDRRYLLPDTGPGSELYRGSGKYISIKVDRANHIHISFYNSVNNTVVYYYAAGRANIGQAPGTAANSNVRVHTIDRVVTGGTWTDISVDDNGNPWIVYGDSSRTGNYDGARLAYKSGSTTGVQFTGELKCPVNNTDITGWEALSMPANYTVGNDRLNIEAWPPTVRGGTLGTAPGWNAAIGYTSDMFRVGYFYYPGWKGY